MPCHLTNKAVPVFDLCSCLLPDESTHTAITFYIHPYMQTDMEASTVSSLYMEELSIITKAKAGCLC